jgi:hypothetical protein
MEEEGGARVNPFDVLPEELSVRILRELSADALVHASAVCAQVHTPPSSLPSTPCALLVLNLQSHEIFLFGAQWLVLCEDESLWYANC